MLAVAGSLQHRDGGPPTWPELPADVSPGQSGVPRRQRGEDQGLVPVPARPAFRPQPLSGPEAHGPVPFLETFDLPENSTSCPRATVHRRAPGAVAVEQPGGGGSSPSPGSPGGTGIGSQCPGPHHPRLPTRAPAESFVHRTATIGSVSRPVLAGGALPRPAEPQRIRVSRLTRLNSAAHRRDPPGSTVLSGCGTRHGTRRFSSPQR
jgi:hypothetical protein